MYKQIPEARLQILKETKEGKTHKDILIHIAELFKYGSYLEIGSQNPENTFNHIPCKKKICVDPDINAKATYQSTSREFWDIIQGDLDFHGLKWGWDLIFLDGMHTCEESKNDLKQSLKLLNPNGTIVIHDANPWNEESQRVPRETQQWNGDVWKTVVDHVALANHLVYTIDTDFGICCIHPFVKREQESRQMTDYYFVFEENKEKFLNLISIDEWYIKIKDISLQAQAGS